MIIWNLLILHNLEVTHFYVQVSQEYTFVWESGSAFLSSALLIMTNCWYPNNTENLPQDKADLWEF